MRDGKEKKMGSLCVRKPGSFLLLMIFAHGIRSMSRMDSGVKNKTEWNWEKLVWGCFWRIGETSCCWWIKLAVKLIAIVVEWFCVYDVKRLYGIHYGNYQSKVCT